MKVFTIVLWLKDQTHPVFFNYPGNNLGDAMMRFFVSEHLEDKKVLKVEIFTQCTN